MVEKEIYIKDMQCVSCEETIYKALEKLDIVSVKVDFVKGIAKVKFDENKVTVNDVEKVIKKEGFKVVNHGENHNNVSSYDFNDIIKIIIIILGGNYVINHFFRINVIGSIYSVISGLVANVPVIDENASLFLLFVIGVLTSFHCVAMCGGINVTQCIAFKDSNAKSPNLMYNLGRVTSYTILGGIVGFIGSIFSLSTNSQGFLYVIVGCFMVLMGLNLFGYNIFRKFIPQMPKRFRNLKKNGNGPYVVGLLNGFMPCGPLQSMQIYALSTGSFVNGALSMFFFSIGTVPLMYIFGKIGEFKNPSLAKQFMKVSAVLVLVMGFVMANRGLALVGFDTNSLVKKTASENAIVSQVEGDVQTIYTDLGARYYPDIVVEKGKKVLWHINATNETLNGCNNEIKIREYGIEKPLEVGDNIIEFTPNEEGVYGYSCWMGMIRATITVIE